MTPEEFVAAMKLAVFDSASDPGGLEPTGRAPYDWSVLVWTWWLRLADHDKAMVRQVMRLTAHSSLFGVFAVLDGVRAVFPGEGDLLLTFVDGERSVLLNDPETGEELHDLWQQEVFPYLEPLPGGASPLASPNLGPLDDDIHLSFEPGLIHVRAVTQQGEACRLTVDQARGMAWSLLGAAIEADHAQRRA